MCTKILNGHGILSRYTFEVQLMPIFALVLGNATPDKFLDFHPYYIVRVKIAMAKHTLAVLIATIPIWYLNIYIYESHLIITVIFLNLISHTVTSLAE